MSRDSSLRITCVVMNMQLNFVFKRALHFSTSVIKLLTALQSFVKLQLLPQHYEPVFFNCFATRMTHPLLVPHLVSNVHRV